MGAVAPAAPQWQQPRQPAYFAGPPPVQPYAAPPAYGYPAPASGGGASVLFWALFGIVLLLGAVLFYFGQVSIVGWAVLGAVLGGMFFARPALLRGGVIVTIGAWIGTVVVLFFALGLTVSEAVKSGQTGAAAQPTSRPASQPGAVKQPASPTLAPIAAAPTAAPKAAAPTSAPAVATSGPKVANASFGLGQTPDQKIVNATDTFKPDTPEIFLSFATSGVKSDTAVDATWVHVPSGSTLKGPTVRVSEDRWVGYSLTKPTAGWPEGQYKVVIALNGVEAGSPGFTVKK